MSKENGNNKLIIAALSIITAVAVIVSVVLLVNSKKPKEKENAAPSVSEPAAPDYAPQQIESQAEPIESEEETSKLPQSSGGGAVSLTYSSEVTLNLKDKTASIMFQNPTRSNQDMVLALMIDGKIIAKSDRLIPGYKISKLDNVDMDKLKAGKYEGKYKVTYYDSKTGEKAVVDTDIPVIITVKE